MQKSVKIKGKELTYPIIQGGMGIGVSMDNLAIAVMNEGCVATLSSAQVGFKYGEEFFSNPKKSYELNEKAIREMIRNVRANTKEGDMLFFNILSVARDYDHIARVAVEEGVDAIVSGAGLPFNLPEFTKDSKTGAIPIVANSRVLNLMCKRWMKRYDMLPDAVVVEGPLAGGHLGVSYEEVTSGTATETSLEERLLDVLNYRKVNGHTYPVFVAGGVFTNEDVKKYMDLGADGVQLATRFIATNECDAHENFKNKFVNAKEEDIVYVKSPVGYPARAIRNKMTDDLLKGNLPVDRCIACVLPCKGKNPDTVYCISDKLVASVTGDAENGLVFTGHNGYRVEKIVSVHELITELKGDIWQK